MSKVEIPGWLLELPNCWPMLCPKPGTRWWQVLWQPRTCSFEDNDIDTYICLVYVYIHLNTNRYSKMNSHNVNTEMFLNPKLLTTCLEKNSEPKTREKSGSQNSGSSLSERPENIPPWTAGCRSCASSCTTRIFLLEKMISNRFWGLISSRFFLGRCKIASI